MSEPESFDDLLAASSLGSEQALAIRAGDSAAARTVVLLREDLRDLHRQTLIAGDDEYEGALAELLFLAWFGTRHFEMPETWAETWADWLKELRAEARQDHEFLADRHDAENG